jgi:hypothetical protein
MAAEDKPGAVFMFFSLSFNYQPTSPGYLFKLHTGIFNRAGIEA